MLYKTFLLSFLGLNGLVSSMVIGERDSSLSSPAEARSPPSIIAIVDVKSEEDEADA
ncbi:hypothetical protein GGS26DRAFT_589486 [Hypomontagnella submonticulosa]|nr:hypothetical protein GGS26DRAFT_589486 [Hypomontagnella submonticulosa]